MSFNIISISLIAVALAMDAFSVSMTKGFTQKNLSKSQILYYGLFFGGFQALMPVLGYFCGNAIASIVETLASIIGFILLLGIGLNMIRESLSSDDEEITDVFSFKEVTLLAIATSIDAFAVGIAIALLKDPILISSIIIGAVAFIFSVSGIFIGKKIGHFVGDKFQILGGVILILIGIKILLGF
ncbi:Putative Mn2+ efflux pump MntP [Methanobrevibacter gottschalkii]|uniref:Putative manganese efflux pump MntP n=2 Tax=Methanobrevibacter gottschalkii TaxID=190974 RepID=A0A3N5B1I8_9EURY|nr:manganese efflux pump MntP family protein [Methanobrevibacter gottschalkii]RPF51019.1 putative Mn2+ efflux pump MntP [Methanobrevibacter gottschalkii DSM 11977]SEL22492.1 Putative Mn2+ efflux pump MntP [Methanobrevibacter gottschalkii]